MLSIILSVLPSMDVMKEGGWLVNDTKECTVNQSMSKYHEKDSMDLDFWSAIYHYHYIYININK